MDRNEITLRGVDWIHLTLYMDGWLAFVNTVTNLSVSQEIARVGEHFFSFLRRTLLRDVKLVCTLVNPTFATRNYV